MNRRRKIIIWSLFLILSAGLIGYSRISNPVNEQILTYTVDTKKQNLQLYWKNDKGEILKSFQNLKSYVESKKMILTFAMNGGMFKKDYSPLGLFIQNSKTLSRLNTLNGKGNFYLKPNGVFYITTENVPTVCKTADFISDAKIKYATQSGPMLIINGHMHSAFKKGSTNLNIRNGVGILPGNKVVFAMSLKEINLYDFAEYFKNLGCKNALYLDGFVSRTYLSEKNMTQTDGNFGVMIGVTVNIK